MLLLSLFRIKLDVTDNLVLVLGGRHDTFDVTVDDIKNGTSAAREDSEFLQEWD